MAKNEVVETGVDNLIRLLKEKGKISIPQASDELKVPQKTIESWVDFLVEEHKIGIEYKFTTPFIFMLEEKKESGDKLTIPKEEFEDMGGISENENMAQIKESEVGDSELVSEDEMHARRTTEKTDNVVEPEKTIESPSEEVDSVFKNVDDLLKEGKIGEAQKEYDELKNDIQNMPESEEADLFNKKMIQVNETFISSLKKQETDIKAKEDQIASLIPQGIQLLNDNNVSDAKKIYQQIQGIYDSIPNLFMERKKLLHNNIIEFHKSLVMKEYNDSVFKIKDLDSQINNRIVQAESFLQKNDFDQAMQEYANINELYKDLPSGFFEQKLQIHNKILKLYEELKISNKVKELHEQLRKLNVNVADANQPQLKLAEQQLEQAKKPPEPLKFPDQPEMGKAEVTEAAMSAPEIKKPEPSEKLVPPPAPEAPSATELPKAPEAPSATEVPKTPVLEEELPPAPKPSAEEKEESSDKFKDGMKLYKDKKYKDAKDIFDAISKENPSHVKAREMSTLIEGLIKNDNSKDIRNKIMLAISAASSGDIKEAKKTLTQVLSQDPGNADAKRIMETLDK